MMPTSVKILFTTCVYLIFSTALIANYPKLDEESIKERIDSLQSSVVSPRYDKVVGSYLRTYTIHGRQKSERILGKTLIYFPLFEAYLKKYQLPEDLKYLAIVESALEPRAVSRAGAVGLWQFMSETGRYFGLEITNQVDERCDPHLSTDAAARYLQRLYKRFNDWELAIAAYNSGGGRVSRAVKRARSKDFWRVKRYLPRETANYVPAFIAATYLMKHYEEHGLEPQLPELDAQLTSTITVNRNLSFYEVAQISGAPLDIIEQLNPAYPNSFIPANPYKGRSLILPKRNMTLFKAYLEADKPEVVKQRAIASAPVFLSQPSSKINSSYEVQALALKPGESLSSLAQQIQIPLILLRSWNQLKEDQFDTEKQIKIYIPIPPKHNPLNFGLEPFAPLAQADFQLEVKPLIVEMQKTSIWEQEIERFLFQSKYLFYWTYKKERVSDIANKLPGISYDEIIELNGLKKDKLLKADTKIKIKKLGR